MKKTFIVIALIFTISILFSQKHQLSNKEYYSLQDKARGYVSVDIDSSFILAGMIEKSNDFLHQSFAKGLQSYLYQLKGDSLLSKQNFKQAVGLLNKANPSVERTKTHALLLNFEGLSEWKRKNTTKALNSYLKGKELSESINDKIQVVKFNSNLALVYGEIKNFSEAIRITQESIRFIDNNKTLYTEIQYATSKSINYINLGSFFQEKYHSNLDKKNLLDSSSHYYKKALLFSTELPWNKLNAQKSIGINYALKKEYANALKIYNSSLRTAKENQYPGELCNINYNIGYIYYENKNYLKSLIHLKKVDSIYSVTQENVLDYINSNYYQSLIYKHFNDPKNEAIHSRIFLEQYEKYEIDLNKEAFDTNNKLNYLDLKKEMLLVQNKSKADKKLEVIFLISVIVVFMILLILLFKSYNDKKRIIKKADLLYLEYTHDRTDKREISFKKILTLSEDQEKEILEKLRNLEEKKFYLKQEFTQQSVAKKLKTNTTYLSNIINKAYKKSFSLHYNELRIEYVINEIINNSRYREYTTQAIAESAGFKNADSFTISFKKKTGLTPYQFINEVKKRTAE